MTGYYDQEDIKGLAKELFASNAELVRGYEKDARESYDRLDTGFTTRVAGGQRHGEVQKVYLPKKAITTVCAKSGGGKTTILLNIAYNLRKQGKRGIIVTLEEPASDLFSKMMCLYARDRLDAGQWRSFYEMKKTLAYGFEGWEHSAVFKKFMGTDGLRFLDGTKDHKPDDPISPTMLQDPRFLREVLEAAKEMGENLDFVIIDYVQIMDAGNGYESSFRNMKEVMQALRYLVGNYNAAIIIGAQMNRQAAFSEFEEWQKEHLADGSEVEKSSNTIFALCIKNIAPEGLPASYMMGFRHLKNRGGNPSTQSLHEIDLQYAYIEPTGSVDVDALG